MSIPLRPLTIYCFDNRVTSLPFARRIIKETAGTAYELQLRKETRSVAYIPEARDRPPQWQSLFQGLIPDLQYKNLANRSSRALLLVETQGRVFAVTYGHAKHLFNYEYVRRGYGLQAVINSVPEDRLHSIDMRQFEKLSMHTRRSTTNEESLQSFGLDWTRDILRAVTGVPDDPQFATRASGADALVLLTRYTLPELPDICDRTLEIHGLDRYKKTGFSYIDWFQPENDGETIAELDSILCTTLLRGTPTEQPSLAADQLLDDTDTGQVRFDVPGQHVTNLDIEKIRTWLRQKTDDPAKCLHLLKRGRVESIEPSNQEEALASLYEALTWEFSLDIQDYMLLSGTWIRISQDYAQRVRNEIKQIGPPLTPLTTPSPTTDEDEYIAFACRDDPTLLNLQGLTDRGDTMSTRIELCDIISTNRTLYCIKYGNKSQVLNHLFRQGAGAASTLLNDTSFLKKCATLLEKAARRSSREDFLDDYMGIFPDSGFISANYEICFCIMKPKSDKWPLCIPYLAQITLQEAWKRMRTAGFRVSIQHIEAPHKPKPEPRVNVIADDSGAQMPQKRKNARTGSASSRQVPEPPVPKTLPIRRKPPPTSPSSSNK